MFSITIEGKNPVFTAKLQVHKDNANVVNILKSYDKSIIL